MIEILETVFNVTFDDLKLHTGRPEILHNSAQRLIWGLWARRVLLQSADVIKL